MFTVLQSVLSRGLLLTLCLLLPGPAAAAWQLESWDNQSVSLVWERDSRMSVETAVGEQGFTIAVPPGAQVSWETEVLSRAPLDSSVGPLPEKNRWGVPLPGARGTFRDVEILRVGFIPLASINGRAERIQKVHLKGTFQAPEGKFRSTFAPQPTAPAERGLKEWLINYPQSRGFRKTEGLGAPLRKTEVDTLPAERVVLRTREKAVYLVTYRDLEGLGVPVDDVDPRNFRIYDAERELPLYVHGENDGTFHQEDYLEFVGRPIEGTLLEGGERSHNSFYDTEARMYLVWSGEQRGLRAPLTPAAGSVGGVLLDTRGAERDARPYRVRVHLEEDNHVLRLGGVAISDVLDLGTEVERRPLSDFWFWENQGADADVADIPFEVSHQPAKDPTFKMVVRVRLQGTTDVLTAPMDHHVRFLINGTDISQVEGVDNTALWAGDEAFLWESAPLNPQILRQGQNTLTLQKINDLRTTSGELVRFQDAYLDYIELEYRAGFRVRNDEIVFSNDFPDSTGSFRYTLTGLNEKEFSLWDTEGRKLVGFNVEQAGGGNQLTFSDETLSLTEYVLTAENRRRTPAMELDTLDDLRSMDNQADYLVIAHPALEGESLDSLVALREAQGLRCRVVWIQDVYHHFGNGSTDPRALKEFVRYAYARWRAPAPAYLLLLGEASMWYAKKSGAFQQDLVPTHLIHIPGWGVTSNDDYFAKVSGDDDIADLWVGRIPVANTRDLGEVVHKIYVHENARPSGNWTNKTLLLGGFEADFTRMNNRLQALTVAAGRSPSRMDVERNSPYYRSTEATPSVYRQLDSAFQVVSFVGHGGGAVWSDAGLLTLDELDSDSLRSSYAIPFVQSITCLTGFFEDVSERSLGEELLRRSQSGAVSFYGASGYISNVAGELLAEELFKASFGTGPLTVGQLVHQGETMVALKTGSGFLPILGEFDLLGDPALRLRLPERQSDLTVDARSSSGGLELTLSHDGSRDNVALASGQGELTVFFGDSVVRVEAVALSGNTWQTSLSFTPAEIASLLHIQGKAVLHYWSGEESYVSEGVFSLMDWLINDVSLSPAPAKVGDAVGVSFQLSGLLGTVIFNGGSVAYSVGDVVPNQFEPGREIALQEADNGSYESVAHLNLAPSGTGILNPKLHLRIRMSVTAEDAGGNPVTYSNIESNIISLPLVAPSDLAWSRPVRVAFGDDLGVYLRIKNRGFGADSNFQVEMTSLGSDTTQDTLTYDGRLNPNQEDSLWAPLSATAFSRLLRFQMISTTGLEADESNNQIDTLLDWKSISLSNNSDTLWIGADSFFVHAPDGQSGRAYARPAPTPMGGERGHLTPYPRSGAEQQLEVTWGPALSGTGAGIGILNRDTVFHWHWFDTSSGAWIRMASTGDNEPGSRSGVYALFNNGDGQGPTIQFHVAGQNLLPDDFIPQNSPLDITLRDNVGLDLTVNPPTLSIASQGDSPSGGMGYSLQKTGAGGKTAVIRWTPDPSVRRDSLEVVAQDVSGNTTRESFVFKYGRGLQVQILGSYPNPFADTAVFAYQLTDFAEKVNLKIYSRSGRLVQSFNPGPGSGYQEVVWDGRSNRGVDVANGIYYLKISARNQQDDASKIFKLFKKKRK